MQDTDTICIRAKTKKLILNKLKFDFDFDLKEENVN